MRRKWRPWKVLLVVFIALVFIFFGWQWYRESADEARLQLAIAATDQVDPYWRLADLVKEYEKLPVSVYFPQAAGPWRGYRGWFGDDIGERPGAIAYDRTGRDYNVRFPLPFLKIIRERLQVTDATGPKAMRDALEQMAYEPAISKIPFDDNDTVQRARYVSNYLLDEMELAAHESRDEALVALLQSQLKLSAYLMATPKPIDHLVGIAVRNQGMSGIRRALALGVRSPEVLLQIQQSLTTADQSHIIHMMRSARAANFDELEQARRNPEQWKKLKDNLMTFRLSPAPSFLDRINYAWKWLEVESAMRSLPLAQAEVLEGNNDAIAQVKMNPADYLRIDLSALPLYVPKSYKKAQHLLARQFVQSSFKLASAESSSLAEMRSLIVAIACERYRLANGVWPKSLAELQPSFIQELPLDPYTGKPLFFQVLPDGIVVYSVGINGIDDGGDVLYMPATPKDRGAKLFNPELRGKKFEEVYPERARPE